MRPVALRSSWTAWGRMLTRQPPHTPAVVTAATVGRVEAYREAPTRIVQRSIPLVTIAGGDVPAPLARAGIEVRHGDSEVDVLWEKLARQAPLALLTALTARPVG